MKKIASIMGLCVLLAMLLTGCGNTLQGTYAVQGSENDYYIFEKDGTLENRC